MGSIPIPSAILFMTKNENWYINKWAKRVRAINFLGGKCEKCGQENIFVFDFHHKDKNDKDKNRGTKAIPFEYKWSIIESEIKKCSLLCANCHIEEHYMETEEEDRDRKNKRLLLEWLNVSGCQICGYDKCNKAIEFHHTKDKRISIGNITNRKRWKTIDDIESDVKEEVLKCDILCSNHHRLRHIDIERFEKYKDIIFSKNINLLI